MPVAERRAGRDRRRLDIDRMQRCARRSAGRAHGRTLRRRGCTADMGPLRRGRGRARGRDPDRELRASPRLLGRPRARQRLRLRDLPPHRRRAGDTGRAAAGRLRRRRTSARRARDRRRLRHERRAHARRRGDQALHDDADRERGRRRDRAARHRRCRRVLRRLGWTGRRPDVRRHVARGRDLVDHASGCLRLRVRCSLRSGRCRAAVDRGGRGRRRHAVPRRRWHVESRAHV